MEHHTTRPSADTARDMLNEAGRLNSAARAGASWPNIAFLLGLGAISSLSLISFWLVSQIDDSLVIYPLIALFSWVAVFFVFMLVFGRSTKRGFGRRWVSTIVAWGVLWVAGMTLFPGRLWFALTVAAAITTLTVVAAWFEARK